MTREEFMQGRAYKEPAPDKQPCFGDRCRWKMLHCELDDWDGYECLDCGARFTERCTFDDDCK